MIKINLTKNELRELYPDYNKAKNLCDICGLSSGIDNICQCCRRMASGIGNDESLTIGDVLLYQYANGEVDDFHSGIINTFFSANIYQRKALHFICPELIDSLTNYISDKNYYILIKNKIKNMQENVKMS